MPKPLLIVGGQAVNLWALHYEDQTRDLAPFTSRGVDVLGDRETLESLGMISGIAPQFLPQKPPSNVVGVVIARDESGAPLLIEVLRQVRGATNEELRAPAYLFAIGGGEVRVQVPGPIALFRAKVANLCEIDQNGRQDARHVRILARLMPFYLADLHASLAPRRQDELKLINFLEQLREILVSEHGRESCCAKLAINRRSLFAGLETSGLPDVQEFLKKLLRARI